MLADTIFNILNRRRSDFNLTQLRELEFYLNPPAWLDMSEDLINEALLNATISTLSLGLWHDTVNVTQTLYRNVYRFSHPAQLLLPYACCLALTRAIVGAGLHALHQNGVAAIDGGFLQVLTTTTGDTKLREAAARGCLGGSYNMPDELLDMKVRFGELDSEPGAVQTSGFGTVEETVPLKRHVLYGRTKRVED